ncbi:hypothetical protein [Candidatus Methylobacter oryzae]|uniref:Uncharacterized protein n=1 Tax=Candidatus Methylobacter oryzae TaxID=2497749 RepID=A0ABY3CFM9_9GAMM|nr:hypothetical protein [Candidatus Methylobacter oryzae]TRX01410.1 hypothetical protein EKO24_003770 [Candidatus Methylobacter oryzae]
MSITVRQGTQCVSCDWTNAAGMAVTIRAAGVQALPTGRRQGAEALLALAGIACTPACFGMRVTISAKCGNHKFKFREVIVDPIHTGVYGRKLRRRT